MTKDCLIAKLASDYLLKDMTTIVRNCFYTDNIPAKDIAITQGEHAELHTHLTLAFKEVLEHEATTVIQDFFINNYDNKQQGN